MPAGIRVLIEAGSKRTFACALDLTGLARSGRTEQAAIEALLATLPRYGAVAAAAGEPFDPVAAVARGVEVVERVPGNATTDFGAPGMVGVADGAPLSAAEAAREARLVAAAWSVLERVAASAPEELRKGPRGGGRDRSKILEHVSEGERGYAAAMGIAGASRMERDELRARLLEALDRPSDGSPMGGRKWPPRYAARRLAWHVLDHAWEMEDRAAPG
jgi:hypothetical protein